MTIYEIREWRKQGLTASDFRYADKSVVIDNLLAEVDKLNTQLSGRTYFHSDAAVEEELKVATEALEWIIADGDFSAPEGMKYIAAAALKEIKEVGNER